MIMTIGALTHRGRVRTHNEDTVALGGYLSCTPAGLPVWCAAETARPVVLAVADGLGGHQAGDRASLLALRTFVGQSDSLRSVDDVRTAIGLANDAVYEEMDHNREWTAMGTTLAGFVFVEDTAICYNVGDSRCYVMVDGSLVQLSTDDSPALPGQSPDATTNIVTQTLGGTAHRVRVDPHVLAVDIAAASRFIACSDGLSDYVSTDKVEEQLITSKSIGDALVGLLSLALAAGAPDNVSVVIGEVNQSHPQTQLPESR